MAYATEKQTSFIKALAEKRGMTAIEAVNEYGFGLTAPSSLTVSQASEVISWLKQPTITKAARDAAEARRAADFAKLGLREVNGRLEKIEA